jgi:hypothetical protein
MIIVRAARLDRHGVGAAGSGDTHPLGDDFVCPVPRGSRQALTGSRRETMALGLRRGRLARQLGDERTECPPVGTGSADQGGQVPLPAEDTQRPKAARSS